MMEIQFFVYSGLRAFNIYKKVFFTKPQSIYVIKTTSHFSESNSPCISIVGC
jgi:hypothetical protein